MDPLTLERSPAETAVLLVQMAHNFAAEAGKDITRAQVSSATFRMTSGVPATDQTYASKVALSMLSLGWTLAPLRSGSLIIKLESAVNWQKVASRYIRPETDRVKELADNPDNVKEYLADLASALRAALQEG